MNNRYIKLEPNPCLVCNTDMLSLRTKHQYVCSDRCERMRIYTEIDTRQLLERYYTPLQECLKKYYGDIE